MADFLVALADFDRRRLWCRLGHASLFYFLHRELGLSRGSAHYRKVAAQLVQRYPEVVEPLREGKLCITAILELARVITPENRVDVLPRFFHRSKQEAKAVAVEILPAAVVPRREVVTGPPCRVEASPVAVQTVERAVHAMHAASPMQSEPLTTELRRLHMTVSKPFLEKLEAARAGQGHAQPGASAEQVLEAALDLLLANQARRRGEVKKPRRNPRPSRPDHVPAAVKRAVRARDEGRCQWPVEGGGTCGSTLRLEIDHVVPRARGGPTTVENCRIVCRFHNQLAARQVYGDEWMDRFTGGQGKGVPVAREPQEVWAPRAALTIHPACRSLLRAGQGAPSAAEGERHEVSPRDEVGAGGRPGAGGRGGAGRRCGPAAARPPARGGPGLQRRPGWRRVQLHDG